jgi:FtsP/CotA-like multicopper oxidase with cupredoxin domain
MITRRHFFTKTAAAAAGATVANSLVPLARADEAANPAQPEPGKSAVNAQGDPSQQFPPGEPGKDYSPVITPNGSALPYKIVDGVKVFHLIPEQVDHEFAPGLRAHCWGFNGQVHGPTIEAVEGDRLRIYVTNRLPEPTTIHWHGVLVPSGMDGVAGLSQKNIEPGETYKYEFQLRQHGTYMYHSHSDDMTQEGLGLMGMFIIHPRDPTGPRPDRDFAFMLSEWRIDVGTMRPNPMEMTDFNVLTLNARVFPGTAPLVAKYGERVRIRFGNLSAMEHHPIHLHGFHWKVVATDGGQIPESAQWLETTVLVAVGQTRTVEFIADNPGDWAMHCHMSHHTMNQMGHNAPNLIGVRTGGLDKRVEAVLPGYMTMGETGMSGMGEMGMNKQRNSLAMVGAPGKYDYIDMGGMFTIVKVRENLTTYDDPGWYETPPGTLAVLASNDELHRDLGQIPKAEPTDDTMKTDHGKMGHLRMPTGG